MKIRTEEEVGILCRVSEIRLKEIKRFRGVVKHRFSDFHVHEIDDHGSRVTLNSFELPNESGSCKRSEIADGKLPDDDTILEWIPSHIKEEIRLLALVDGGSTNTKLEINVTSADKSARTKIHRWLSNFDNLGSETIERDGGKFIQVSRMSRKGKDKYKETRRPHNRARFTHSVLYKQGIDTTDAINYLCRKLRLHSRHITFAGTKDKQAKTVQRICFSNIDAKRLLRLNEYSTHSKLGNFSYEDSPLHLGQLQGNHFKILVREVHAQPDSAISLAIESLSSNGFVNYFGLQRFGSFRTSTHLIGKALLQMNWMKAFDLILEPNEGRDRSYMKKAKKLWLENRDPVKAMKEIPQHHMSIEASLIHGLSKFYSTSDHWSSFCTIPRNTRTFYFHSYQSYLWNHLASHRIQQYGLRPVVGDVVFIDTGSDSSMNDNVDIVVDEIELLDQGNSREADTRISAEEFESKLSKETAANLKVLSEEDLPNYTIFDVIIPIEGSEVTIPESCNLKPFWNKLLADNDVIEGFSNFRPRSEIPRGSLRKVVVLPGNVNYEIIRYNGNENLDTFIESDYDLILQKDKVCKGESTGTRSDITSDSDVGNKDLEKDKTCVIVEFSLPSSSYATIALREILDETEEYDSASTNFVESFSPKDKRKRDEGSSDDDAKTGDDVILVKKRKESGDGGGGSQESSKTGSNAAGESQCS